MTKLKQFYFNVSKKQKKLVCAVMRLEKSLKNIVKYKFKKKKNFFLIEIFKLNVFFSM